jgi:hypothetical protein
MIVLVSFNEKELLVRQLLVRPDELLIAFPGPATLRQTRFLGPERIASQSILFPSHKAIREYPGLGKLIAPRREETWIFCLQAHEFPTLWASNIASVGAPKGAKRETVPGVGLKVDLIKMGLTRIRVLKIKAGQNEVQLTIPEECRMKPFQEAPSDFQPNLFDRVFGEEKAL